MFELKKIVLKSCLLIFFIWSQAIAQSNISTDGVSVLDGLSNNSIIDIFQDQYGYMWFASIDGINMYDGYEITVFKNIPGDSTSLPHNRTFRGFEDSEGTIWISTESGLARFNRNSKTFTTFKYSDSDAEPSNRVIDIFEDSKNMLWVTTQNGTLEFDRVKEKFNSYDVIKTDNNIAAFGAYSGVITESKAGELYNFSWSYGLLKFDYEGSVFLQIDLKDNFNDYLSSKVYFDSVFDPDGNLWIGFSDGLAKIDLKEMTAYDITPFQRQKNPNGWAVNGATGLFLDKNENIWVATGRNGMFIFDKQNQKFEKLTNNSSTRFSRFYEDNSGLLWFGSSRGALKYDFNRKPFELYTLSNNIDENKDNSVYSFAKTSAYKNSILLGTPNGIKLFEKKNQKISNMKSAALSKLNNKSIAAIIERKDGVLWVATDDNGLWSQSPRLGSLKNYSNILYDNSSLIDNRVRSLALDSNENLWIGTIGGLQILKNSKDKLVTAYSNDNRKYNSSLVTFLDKLQQTSKPISSIIGVGDYVDLSKEFIVRQDTKALIYALGEGLPRVNMVDFGWLESENGDTLWSGSHFGESFHAGGHLKNRIQIGMLDLKAGRYKLRYISDDSHSAQAFNQIPPPDSSFWGTQVFAISEDEFEKSSRSLKRDEEKTYLAGNEIFIVYCDSKGNTWVGTNNGISKIDSNLIVENYFHNPADYTSLSNNNATDIKEDKNGNIWIATFNGLNKFNPDDKTFLKIWERDGLPSSNLSAIEVDKEGNLWVSGLKGISKIELNKNDDNFVIVNYDVKDGLQGYEFIRRSSFIDETGKLYFGGRDGFNAFYPGSSNRTPPSLVIQDIKFSNKSINEIEQFGNLDLNQLNELSLTHNQNDLSFEFASIHFSRPDKNRIMYKMDGIDEDWVNGERRIASYTNLTPGDYVFNLRGSNGDGVWNEGTKKINIHIAAPWYNNWTAYFIYAFLFFGLLFSVRKFEIARQKKNAKIKESQLKIESAEALAKAAESDKRALQVEFEHKKKELEEARQLQLSMLPSELPQLANLDIAVYMKTATEVGGDYYDFHIGLDGTLTVVIGDATGHGMKAGTMVTTSKSLFNVLAPNPNIVETFQEMTRCLKLMQMEKLSMCMTMLKIAGNKLQMSAAGMPPIFIYKRESQSMEEHLIKGMPLGTFNNFPYEILESKISSGDTILLMTDGFPELLNDKNEMFGYKRARNLFEDLADQSPEEIITNLKNAGSEWANDKDPDDDVTFVVIKVK